jgi:DNA-binding NtrC family response regulator
MAKILIVEDERSIRQALLFELSEQGHEVHCASVYSEAVNAMRAFQYDVIISDIFLDTGTCVQLMGINKQMSKDTPFIVMSAYPDSYLGLHIKNNIKDRFFRKPFMTTALTQKVHELLNKNFVKNNVVTEAVF